MFSWCLDTYSTHVEVHSPTSPIMNKFLLNILYLNTSPSSINFLSSHHLQRLLIMLNVLWSTSMLNTLFNVDVRIICCFLLRHLGRVSIVGLFQLILKINMIPLRCKIWLSEDLNCS